MAFSGCQPAGQVLCALAAHARTWLVLNLRYALISDVLAWHDAARHQRAVWTTSNFVAPIGKSAPEIKRHTFWQLLMAGSRGERAHSLPSFA